MIQPTPTMFALLTGAEWMSEPVHQDVVAVCVGGVASRYCSLQLQELNVEGVVDAIVEPLREGRLVLVVSPGFKAVNSVYGEVERWGLNSLMVEVAGVPELIASGLSLDELVGFNIRLLSLTRDARSRALRVHPRVTRRELLRGLLTLSLPSQHSITPQRVRSSCASSCPYNAVRADGRVAVGECLGCMFCKSFCEKTLNPILSKEVLLHLYGFIASKGLDGVVFVCRRQLGLFEDHVTELSPARFVPVKLPCISWLSMMAVDILKSLGVEVVVFVEQSMCAGCMYAKASLLAVEKLVKHGVLVGARLSKASSYAYTGYSRLYMGVEEARRLIEGMNGG